MPYTPPSASPLTPRHKLSLKSQPGEKKNLGNGEKNEIGDDRIEMPQTNGRQVHHRGRPPRSRLSISPLEEDDINDRSSSSSPEDKADSIFKETKVSELRAALKSITHKNLDTDLDNSSTPLISPPSSPFMSSSSAARTRHKPDLKLVLLSSNLDPSSGLTMLNNGRPASLNDVDGIMQSGILDDLDSAPSSPSMVRKKSGELVKSSLKPYHRRPASLPSTPQFGKSVRFNDTLEHVRHFLQAERPTAVSANTSPTNERREYFGADAVANPNFPLSKEYTINLPNFAHSSTLVDSDKKVVQLESIRLSNNGRSLVGFVQVCNIAYHKSVAVRFSFDKWQTVSEVTASFTKPGDVHKLHGGVSVDRFVFTIRLVDYMNLEERDMLFCIRYHVNGIDYWDNNNGGNYIVEFHSMPFGLYRVASYPPESISPSASSAENNPLREQKQQQEQEQSLTDVYSPGGINETQKTASSLASRISEPVQSFLADMGESSSSMKHKQEGRRRLQKRDSLDLLPNDPSDIFPSKRPTGVAFNSRYDFGASLSAAIAATNEALARSQSSTNQKVLASGGDSNASPSILLDPGTPTDSNSDNTSIKTLPEGVGQSKAKSRTENLNKRSYFTDISTSFPGNNSTQPTRTFSPEKASDRPAFASSKYAEFLNTYCFFEGSSKPSAASHMRRTGPVKSGMGAPPYSLSAETLSEKLEHLRVESNKEQEPLAPSNVNGSRSPEVIHSPFKHSGTHTPVLAALHTLATTNTNRPTSPTPPSLGPIRFHGGAIESLENSGGGARSSSPDRLIPKFPDGSFLQVQNGISASNGIWTPSLHTSSTSGAI